MKYDSIKKKGTKGSKWAVNQLWQNRRAINSAILLHGNTMFWFELLPYFVIHNMCLKRFNTIKFYKFGVTV